MEKKMQTLLSAGCAKNLYEYVPRFRRRKTVNFYFSTLYTFGILQEQNWFLGIQIPLVPLRQSKITAKEFYIPTRRKFGTLRGCA
jgi:hypothetical protein